MPGEYYCNCSRCNHFFHLLWLVRSVHASLFWSEDKKIQTYSLFKGQEVGRQPSCWCMMRVGRDSVRNVNFLLRASCKEISFLGGQTFPFRQLYIHGAAKSVTRGPRWCPHPLAAGQVFSVFLCVFFFVGGGDCSRGSGPLSHDRKGRR